MKKQMPGGLLAALLFPIAVATAQPVVKVDAVSLLDELAAPPATLAEAYQRAYSDNNGPDATPYYQAWISKVEQYNKEGQTLQMQFYQKNPTGIRPAAQPVSRVSAQQQSAMDGATSELAQKMMNDPAFAQKFMQMSETEQHAYIAKLLADKGIKPVDGQPDRNQQAIPGSDVDWMTLYSEYMQTANDMSRWNAQTELQTKYDNLHQEVNAWAEAEIKKLPMISYGEYGHDHDPEKVKEIRRKALGKHRDLADAMMKEAAGLFAQFRSTSRQRMAALNDALKGVQYGASYDFGIHYPSVLGAQMMLVQEPYGLLTNEISVINSIAQWEQEWRNFE